MPGRDVWPVTARVLECLHALIGGRLRDAASQETNVHLQLGEDGILAVVAGEKKLWSSTLTPLGKHLPPFRCDRLPLRLPMNSVLAVICNLKIS